MSTSSRIGLRLLASGMTTALLLSLLPSVRADLFFLKDGFVLSGKLKRESTTEVDPYSHEPFQVAHGFYMVDDGARITYISPRWVGIAETKAPPDEEKIVDKTYHAILEQKTLPPILQVTDEGAFDAKWTRTLSFRGDKRIVTVPQRLGLLTPYYCRVDCTKTFNWSSAYLTRELGREKVRDLIANHPEFDEQGKTDAQVAAMRFRFVDFFVQAGWYEEADETLQRIIKELPEAKEKAERLRDAMAGMAARDRLDVIKRAHLAGQPLHVRRMLKDFPVKNVSPQVTASVTTLRADYQAVYAKLAEVRHFLEELPPELKEDKETLVEAAEAIRTEVLPETLVRLDPFLLQAQQAARQRAAGKTPDLSPRELLALAVTGWLLGSPSAESKPEHAVRLWKARQLVLEYQKTTDPAGRQRLLAAYRSDKDGNVPLDELVQLIPTLPPAEPEENTEGVLQLQVGGANAAKPGGRPAVPKYLVQLPREYQHSRSYPVLIVLHDSDQTPRDMLDKWSSQASDHGYILVAPQWEGGSLGSSYQYTAKEHTTVTETLRDLRRRFQIDSDRVFLFGAGQGGFMAFDVGMAHPDLFAGVMPMSAAPVYYAERCWRNAQYLPFYMMTGGRQGPTGKQVRTIMDHWVERNYPMLWVEYKGRGAEWFSGELPNLFDWMRAKRRSCPMQELGTGNGTDNLCNEFTLMRPDNDSFYWLTADDVDGRRVTPTWNPGVRAAIMSARIDPSANEIVLQLSGVKHVTVWLGRNARGENLVDFDKPVTVRVGATIMVHNRTIQPSLETLLEDLFQRGDRQRLRLAKIELKF